jgi:hypothetical protein
MGSENAETKKSLDQRPPSARRHGCATTATHATTGPVLLVLSEQHMRDPRNFDIGWSNLDSNFVAGIERGKKMNCATFLPPFCCESLRALRAGRCKDMIFEGVGA